VYTFVRLLKVTDESIHLRLVWRGEVYTKVYTFVLDLKVLTVHDTVCQPCRCDQVHSGTFTKVYTLVYTFVKGPEFNENTVSTVKMKLLDMSV
jgi:hypothetical protein